MLFTVSPVVLIELSGMASYIEGFLPVNIAALIGLVVLFICLALGVIIWIGVEAKEKEYKFLDFDEFETLYGVDGVVKEKKKSFENRKLPMFITAILLFILSPVGIITAGLLEANGFVIVSMICFLLLMVAAGVGLMIYTARISKSYNNLLKEERLTPAERKARKIKSKLGGAYWCLIVAVFLVLGLGFDLWQTAGIIFPVAGVLYAAVIGIVKIFTEK